MALPGRLSAFLGAAYAKPLLVLLGMAPALNLIAMAATDALGPNPAEALIRSTGDWTMRLLCIALSVTPLRVAIGLPVLARYRRMAGLLVYLYATLHLLTYAWLDHGFGLGEIVKDVIKRPFITVGILAFVLLTPMAFTSFDAAARRLGGYIWRQLHRAVFAVAGLALLHFFWMRSGKHDYAEVAIYALILGALIGWRLLRAVSRRY